MHSAHPPKWPLRLLRFFVKEDYLEEIEGDMEELFQDYQMQHPIHKAKRLYTFGVLSLLRPTIIKASFLTFTTTDFNMLGHHWTLFIRNAKRFRSTFLINLLGLSTGLAGAILIFFWINDERQIDRFHENDARLFQVMQNFEEGDEIVTEPHTSGLLASALAEEIPEVEAAVAVADPLWGVEAKGILSVDETFLKAKALFVGRDFFKLFSFPMLDGNPEQALHDQNRVLISEDLALKLFDRTEDLVGKTVEWKQHRLSGPYTIGGVFANLPDQSTLRFDLLFPYQLMFAEFKRLHHWNNSDPSTYLLLREGTDLEQFNQKIQNFGRDKFRSETGNDNISDIGTLFAQKYSERYLKGKYENGQIAGGRIAYVQLFAIIALFLLVIACINFMNLSTARASRRLKEIGIKKVVGASRKTLIQQYFSESIFVAFLSLFIALLIAWALLPQFNSITGKSLALNWQTRSIVGILAIGLLTGLFAGSYPALYLSAFKPVAILKGKIHTSIGEILARKSLVVFQFTISIILIVSVLVVYRQIAFVHNKNLGYNRDNIITFTAEGRLEDHLDTFFDNIRQIPGVVAASSFGHNLTGDYGGTTGLHWEGKSPEERIEFGNLEVDYGLIDLLDFEMLSGRTFSREFASDTAAIIFNESAIKAMGLQDPIGKSIKLWGEDRQIIGVAKDFHYSSLYESVGPCFFQCYPNLDNVLVKIQAGKEADVIAGIRHFYQSQNHGLPFEYRFLDEDYQELYASERRVAILSKYFAIIAIVISCLGLFGLAAFTAERRLKEIGIRKILGSSNLDIIRLLSSDFTKMVAIAIVLALPVSYWIAENWLAEFAYKIELQWWFFAGAALLTILIAWLTVGLQTFRAARVQPVQCLKDE